MNSPDTSDQEWLALVRPAAYENPVPRDRYNLVVIGAGKAGLVAATGAAALGARVALIERNLIGGTRLNTGDVPSKILIRAARALAEARRAREFGIQISGEPHVDFAAVMQRVRRLRAQIASNDSVTQLTQRGVDVYFGEARFEDGDHISVGDRKLAFARALIATGSSPVLPQIPDIKTVSPLTSETLFGLEAVPPRLAIVGGDSIGCEMAQVFARLGSRVIVYDTEPRILTAHDLAPAEIVRDALQRDGVVFRLACTKLRFENINGVKRLHGSTADAAFTDEFDEVFVSGGRIPNVEGLNLAAAHIDCDEHRLLVNDRLRTTNSHVFAAGDVCSQYKSSHVADAQARMVIANALFFSGQRMSSLLIPWCTYTDPEIARVGIGETHPRCKLCLVADLPFKSNDRAVLDGQEEGMLRIYHDRRGGILGATLVAAHAGEVIGEIVVAMRHHARLGSLASDIHPYPTQSEILKRAGDMYRRTLLTPPVISVLRRIMKWRR